MAGAFRDFIPEGEDTGALGKGFRDFVPPVVPQVHEEPKEEPIITPEPIVTPIKTKKAK